MGVPAFFRWLSRKYPSIVVHGSEDKVRQLEDGTTVPVDASLPNPNGVEFDNLYLDMNGIIHPCCHPEDRPAPKNEEEMMILIFEYIDRIFRLVRPRRLLYMAIDGVAPRAKMNQQRSRRFRSSKEVVEKEEEVHRVRQRLMDEGLGVLVGKSEDKSEKFDSNCITPGTQFMANLAANLRYYIHDRLTNDPGWAKISVILSDASVPGEGEHKIMDFIRKQRGSPHHDPNTHHCLCGADADLIMLGLATHEANFTIIREEFKPNAPRSCELCGQIGHELKYCNGLPQTAGPDDDREPPPPQPATEFIFLRLSVLREYLEKDLTPDRAISYKFDLERAIDDWVFMCFFVGNDFLPHLPSLEIREGAIDRLIDIYKGNADRAGGYLTENGFVNYERVQIILTELGKMEDGILRNRMYKAKNDRRREKERERANKRRFDEEDSAPNKRRRTEAPAFELGGAFAAQAVGQFGGPLPNARQTIHDARVAANTVNMSSAQKLRAMLVGGNEQASPSPARPPAPSPSQNEKDDEDPNDVVRLGEEGWKQRYYMNKFAVVIDEDVDFQRHIVKAYVEGLSWVLAYYYQGCPSWNWYYPYHYSPFASDFVNISALDITFPMDTKPFRPLEQLMAVFPAASGNFLPDEWRKLMSEPNSSILDFYPSDFCVDLNGKKFAWQGVALLPFVDEDRLLSTLETVYSTLTEDEVNRNTRGETLLFAGRTHDVTAALNDTFYSSENANKPSELTWLNLPAESIYGMAGLMALDTCCHWLDHPVPAPYPSLPILTINAALSVCYQDPQYPDGYRYLAKRLPRAKSPPRVLVEGRAQMGFDPNRQRTNLNPSAHRMLSGAIRGGGGGRGRDFYDNRNSYSGNHDGRRSYNEEREPRRDDSYRRHSDFAHEGGRGGGYPPAPYAQQQYNYPPGRSAYDGRQRQPDYPTQGRDDYRAPASGHPGGGHSFDARYQAQAPSAGYGWVDPNRRDAYDARNNGNRPQHGGRGPPEPPRYYTSNYRRSN